MRGANANTPLELTSKKIVATMKSDSARSSKQFLTSPQWRSRQFVVFLVQSRSLLAPSSFYYNAKVDHFNQDLISLTKN
jgi:hypothetical protein